MKLIAKYLRLLAEWLDPLENTAILTSAKPLVKAAEEIFGPGFGEAKRHYVYAALIKLFPGVSKRLLSRTIEAAL